MRGYKEKGNINTPLELAMRNRIDCFTAVIDAIDRAPKLRAPGARVTKRNAILGNLQHAFGHDTGRSGITGWTRPG